jgi:putative RecB family exonuclease
MNALIQMPYRAEKRHAFEHLSFSALSLFQQCPLRFHFRYVLGLPEESIGASLVFGRAIHAALEFHFNQLLMGLPAPTLDTLLDAFQEAWREHVGPEIRFGKGEDINTLGRLAERMLRTFQRSELARPAGTIIAIEEELRGDLVAGAPPLLGRLDLAIETEDFLNVTDFKTARSQWSAEHVVGAAPQLLLYSELAKPLADGKPMRLAFAVLTKTQAPALHLHPVEPDPAQIQRMKRIVERVWRGIASGNFYPNPSPMNCPGCPYRRPCRAWMG